MNLYLVLAIALGAISGVIEAPAARPVATALAARRGVEAVRRAVRARLQLSIRRAPAARSLGPALASRHALLIVAAARPRAPAVG
jgi:hypothetical protein